MNTTSLFTDHDIYLFKEGNHFRLYNKLGSHRIATGGITGVCFAVWAPNAEKVSVVGDFNQWNKASHPLTPRKDGSGIWERFIEGIENGTVYKYHIISRHQNYMANKGDPLRCDMPVELVWEDINQEISLPKFRPVV